MQSHVQHETPFRKQPDDAMLRQNVDNLAESSTDDSASIFRADEYRKLGAWKLQITSWLSTASVVRTCSMHKPASARCAQAKSKANT